MSPRALWRGRLLVFSGILLLSLNLRIVVAATSPIFPEIGEDILLDPIAIGILGSLPPLVFASAGFMTPILARAIGQSRTVVLGLLLVVVGQLLRSFAPETVTLLLGTAVAIIGMGFGNVLLPSLVKRYFPDRIGTMTALYSGGMAVSTMLPPLVAVPVADTAGWRVSLASWILLTVIALVPWIMVAVRDRATAGLGGRSGVYGRTITGRELWRSPIALTLAALQVVSATIAYSMFAWLPQISMDLSGLDPAAAGSMLSLFAAVGLPFAILVPIIAHRMRTPTPFLLAATAFAVSGSLGLMLLPGAEWSWLWFSLLGFAPLLFPLVMVLITDRTRTEGAAISLSGFVNLIGYLGAALGPLAIGVLHSLSDGWTVPLGFLATLSLLPLLATVVLRRRRMLEDTLGDGDGPEVPEAGGAEPEAPAGSR